MNVLKDFEFIATNRENGVLYLSIDPAELYPKVIKRIKECMARDEAPAELVNSDPNVEGAAKHQPALDTVAAARQLPVEAWDYALQSRDDFAQDFPGGNQEKWKAFGASQEKIDEWNKILWRAAALEIALGWFQKSIRHANRSKYSLMITTGLTPEQKVAGERPPYRLV